MWPCQNFCSFCFLWREREREREREHRPTKMKHSVLSKLGKVPNRIRAVIENTKPDSLYHTQ